MPQQTICERCSEVLYNGPDLKTPDEINLLHNGKCPKCGKKLSFDPINVEVKPS